MQEGESQQAAVHSVLIDSCYSVDCLELYFVAWQQLWQLSVVLEVLSFRLWSYSSGILEGVAMSLRPPEVKRHLWRDAQVGQVQVPSCPM